MEKKIWWNVRQYKIFYDDFGEGSETRIGKTTIIYSNNENKDEFENFFIKKHNKYDIPLT